MAASIVLGLALLVLAAFAYVFWRRSTVQYAFKEGANSEAQAVSGTAFTSFQYHNSLFNGNEAMCAYSSVAPSINSGGYVVPPDAPILLHDYVITELDVLTRPTPLDASADDYSHISGTVAESDTDPLPEYNTLRR
jgi:hypothetical protein